MIKELGMNTEPNWNETINVSLTLKDLQYIYDCIGGVPTTYLKEKHNSTEFFNKINNADISTLYEELDYILDRHNGITDNDSRINDVELVINK